MKWYQRRRYTGTIRAVRSFTLATPSAILTVTPGKYGYDGTYRLTRSPATAPAVVFCRHYGPTRARSWAMAMQGLRVQANYLAAVAARKGV